MDSRSERLIASLDLAPHPEGGYFREIYRSGVFVQPLDGRPQRAALTTIYFLLTAGQVSRWHRVGSDEAWHYLEGDALELFTADAGFEKVPRHVLGCVVEGVEPVHVVSRNTWQAARTMGAYTLLGCTVGPGFEFADFELLRDVPAELETARRKHPFIDAFV